MRIAVVGAGAMGSTLGGLLALGGAQMTFFDPFVEHMERIEQSGLELKVNGESHRITGIHANTFSAEQQPLDLILVMVKGGDTINAMERASGLIGPDTVVASFQNGLGNTEKLRTYFTEDRILYGCVNITGKLAAPGAVEATVLNPDQSILIGALADCTRLRAIGDRLAELFNHSGAVRAVYTQKIESAVWNKVLVNCAVNPLSAVLGMPVPRILRHPDGCAMAQQIAREVAALALKKGISGVDAEQFISKTLPALAAGPENYSSMANDLLFAKRKTEIDQMNGAVVGYAEQLGIELPVCSLMTRLIHLLEDCENAHKAKI